MIETEAVKERYERRKRIDTDQYSLLTNTNLLSFQERQRIIARLLRQWLGARKLSDISLIEVGCGSGTNILELTLLGANPAHMIGNELLDDRIKQAQLRVPAKCVLIPGDATALDIKPGSVDLVVQSTVFSSILDSTFRKRLAAIMFSWLKPGGAILWYDFTFNNPKNPDVRGVDVNEIRMLFPKANIIVRRCTLAPPIARRLGVTASLLYNVFNAIPFLRTHVVCLITKTG